MRREWIEMAIGYSSQNFQIYVSLHAEGVDWNTVNNATFERSKRSPSMRREWIEMPPLYNKSIKSVVSLHAEGVDWNMNRQKLLCALSRLPPCGGSGLKLLLVILLLCVMGLPPCGGSGLKWKYMKRYTTAFNKSPSMRREWIEIYIVTHRILPVLVSLHAEGVDWNEDYDIDENGEWVSPSMRREWIEMLICA